MLPGTTESSSSSPPHSAAAFPDWALAGAIFLLALLARVVYLFEVRGLPFFEHLIADSETYRDWARVIASGDWLGREVFYQAPLYPYFLAVTMKVAGENLLLIRLVQVLAGSAACVLLFYAGRRAFSRAAGVFAGVVLALYPPAIFFDGLIQKAVLDGVGVAALLLLLAHLSPRRSAVPAAGAPATAHAAHPQRPAARPAWQPLLGLGLCLGLLILTRENALLFAPLIALWLLLAFGELSWRLRARNTGLFLAGVLLPLMLVGARNYAVGGEFILTTYQGGPNFFIGNHRGATGTYVPLRSGRGNTPFERIDATLIAQHETGRRLSPREVSAFWFGKGLEFVREQPGEWLALLARKAFYALHSYEVPDSEDLYFYERNSRVLRSVGWLLHFGMLLPLGALGAVLCWREPRSGRFVRLVVILAVSVAAGVALFYAFARYRYPMAPMLILLGAGGVVEAVRRLRTGRAASLTPGVLAAGLAAVLANAPTPYDGQVQLATSYSNAGLAAARAGDLQRGRAYLNTALELAPTLREARYGLGKVLLMSGEFVAGTTELQAAYDAGPDVPYITSALGTAALIQGDLERAAELLERAARGDPQDAETWINLADVHQRRRNWVAARSALESARKADPRELAAAQRLALLLAAAPDTRVRDGAAALAIVDEAQRLVRGADAGLLGARAAALAELGRFEEAAAAAERAAQLAQGLRQHDFAGRLTGQAGLYRSRQPLRLE